MRKAIHLIGFGSQGSAWAECLRSSGWEVSVYLARKGPSFGHAKDQGFDPALLLDLTPRLDLKSPNLIAMLCPDHLTAPIYREYLAASPAPLILVLAHGYAIYSGDLKFAHLSHRAALLAPKAIGPKLLAEFRRTKPHLHPLAAAFFADERDVKSIEALATGLGFAAENLIPASFEQETIGDLISEQGLLCGGVFTLLEWTMKAMREAGVPEKLIREECLTELELIAGMLRERGPATTFGAISKAAQAGTIAMQERFLASDFREAFEAQVKTVTDKKFVDYFQNSKWSEKAEALKSRLAVWEKELKK